MIQSGEFRLEGQSQIVGPPLVFAALAVTILDPSAQLKTSLKP